MSRFSLAFRILIFALYLLTASNAFRRYEIDHFPVVPRDDALTKQSNHGHESESTIPRHDLIDRNDLAQRHERRDGFGSQSVDEMDDTAGPLRGDRGRHDGLGSQSVEEMDDASESMILRHDLVDRNDLTQRHERRDGLGSQSVDEMDDLVRPLRKGRSRHDGPGSQSVGEMDDALSRGRHDGITHGVVDDTVGPLKEDRSRHDDFGIQSVEKTDDASSGDRHDGITHGVVDETVDPMMGDRSRHDGLESGLGDETDDAAGKKQHGLIDRNDDMAGRLSSLDRREVVGDPREGLARSSISGDFKSASLRQNQGYPHPDSPPLLPPPTDPFFTFTKTVYDEWRVNSPPLEAKPWEPLRDTRIWGLIARLHLDKAWNLSREEVEAFVKLDAEFRMRNGFQKYRFTRGKLDPRDIRDVPRLVHLLLLKRWVVELGIFNIPGTIVDCNGYNPETDYFKFLSQTKHIMSYSYKGRGRGDLDNMTDLVDIPDISLFIVPQTMEHVQDVHQVIRNMGKKLIIGGLVYVNAPWINKPHEFHHVSQFTALGMATAFESNGFKVLRCQGWGNAEYIEKLMINRDWPDYMQMSSFDTPEGFYSQYSLIAQRL